MRVQIGDRIVDKRADRNDERACIRAREQGIALTVTRAFGGK